VAELVSEDDSRRCRTHGTNVAASMHPRLHQLRLHIGLAGNSRGMYSLD